jgi:hypothetical protein
MTTHGDFKMRKEVNAEAVEALGVARGMRSLEEQPIAAPSKSNKIALPANAG